VKLIVKLKDYIINKTTIVMSGKFLNEINDSFLASVTNCILAYGKRLRNFG
jgi:hypothetical protein